MNVRCPQCETTFRVDPERIPASGIKARCSRCSTVFELSRQGARAAKSPAVPASAVAASPAPAAPRVASPPAPTPVPVIPSATAPATPPTPSPVQAAPRPLPPRDLPAPAPTAASAPGPAAVGPPAGKRPSFRNQDPGARAQRLARALVSDIVAYNKDKVRQSGSAAALRTEFREEIRKSWEEYVEQVGLELAKSTPYFRDALNEILARGQKVF